MARVRRRYTPEFKAEVVELIRSSGKTASEVGRDLGISKTTVANWVAQGEVDRGAREGLTTQERLELAKLPKEVRLLREERDILKKAAAFFATETR